VSRDKRSNEQGLNDTLVQVVIPRLRQNLSEGKYPSPEHRAADVSALDIVERMLVDNEFQLGVLTAMTWTCRSYPPAFAELSRQVLPWLLAKR
jgi:hypothetical protein